MKERDSASVDAEAAPEPGDVTVDHAPVVDLTTPTDDASNGHAASQGGRRTTQRVLADDDTRRAPVGRVSRQAAKAVPVAVRPVRAPIKVVRRSVVQTAALRESLAEKEAEANDLRDSIELLRQQLDTERGQVARSRPRRSPWWWVLAALLFASLVVWLTQCSGSGGSTQVSSGASAVAQASSSANSSAQASQPAGTATAGASELVTNPMRWPGGAVLVPAGAPSKGPGIDAPGADVTYALDQDGTSVDVFERLYLATPSDTVTASLPSLSGLTHELGRAKLGVQDLQIELDGAAVAPVQTSATRWTGRLPAGTPVSSAVLRYRLTGAIMRLEPAIRGRYAGLLTPLTASGPLGSNDPVNLRIAGRGLRSLTCPTAKDIGVLCGKAGGTTATATIPAGTAPIAQLQLDR